MAKQSTAIYPSLDRPVWTGETVIVAHPSALGTNLDRAPPERLVAINESYIWRCLGGPSTVPWSTAPSSGSARMPASRTG
jgi:hypothetical protein